MSNEFRKPTSEELLKPTFKPNNPEAYKKIVQSLNYKDQDPKLGEWETLRTITMWTGHIFPAQLETLKIVGHSLCNNVVTISIDTDHKKITFSSKGKTDERLLKQVVLVTLGPGWSVQNDTGTVVKSRKSPKSKGTRGRKKNK